MAKLKSNDVTIDYNIYGKGSVNLLFVHGSYIDQTYWTEQVKYFENDYSIITLDLAGHGKSGRERKNWSIERFADDVVNLIKELDLKNVILVGHSLGSDVNLIAASKFPEPIIGFVIVDNFKNAATPLPAEFENQVDTILENLKKDFAGTNEQYARMALLTEKSSPEITNKIVAAYRNTYEPMGQATMPEVFELYKTEKRLLPDLNLKIYLVNVNYMPTNEQALKDHAPHGFELKEIDGTCHFPMLENPEILNESLSVVFQEILGDITNLD
ncbi:alpha/beta fold hydrolase [Dyadobacter subterraneus]|uniref:Alpha/beta hydrolase n=1 Tax=Dyadobacter subterraneus TaxID=2773304 RepID=A0ABR9WLS1_9BACT|nr:alpha/beta hydrolase [Dyadobacter subterraneus]MBE9466475.1 alpha/beta hydrolase [Dyadobacter subterraneus]